MDKDEYKAFQQKLDEKDREKRQVISYYQDTLDLLRIEVADLIEENRALKGQLQILSNDKDFGLVIETTTIN